MQPIVFQPLYMERVWGGRSLESVFGRELPEAHTPYGESWEMTDREGEQSVVTGGPFNGKTLNELWKEHREVVFGKGLPESERFPLLIKILDAKKDLSVQVHPPEEVARELREEAKTEMWYIANVKPEGQLYVGLKEGVTETQFKKSIQDGKVEQCIHAISPEKDQSIHIESGRLHAIGSGLLIYEIQQNSDTTYRVFDWNRLGLDGKPRQLHVEESLKCIDFTDIEPGMDVSDTERISTCEHFHVSRRMVKGGNEVSPKHYDRFSFFTVLEGVLVSSSVQRFQAGDFFLMPAQASALRAEGDAVYLETMIPV